MRRGSGHVVVVGAGLVGLAAACELTRAAPGRRFSVTVLEKSIAGATSTTASSAAAGILGPQLEHDDDGPTLALGLEGARATARLIARLGQEVDLNTRAAVKLAFDDDAARALERRAAWQSAKGLNVELVDGDAARARVPALSRDVVRAAFFPDDHCLDPRKYLTALRALARDSGVDVVEGTLAGVLVEGGRCVGVRTEAGELRADAVVLCAGAWSALAPGVRELLGLTLDDVHPVKGQIVVLDGAPGVVDRVIYGPGGYLVPRRDGRVVCGSTMERAGFDTAVTEAGVDRIVAGARRAVPALADAPVRDAWAGLRPATRDGLPLLGETLVEGLWLSTGHFRNGVLLAAVSAEIVANLLSGEHVSLDLLPFRPERLGCSR